MNPPYSPPPYSPTLYSVPGFSRFFKTYKIFPPYSPISIVTPLVSLSPDFRVLLYMWGLYGGIFFLCCCAKISKYYWSSASFFSPPFALFFSQLLASLFSFAPSLTPLISFPYFQPHFRSLLHTRLFHLLLPSLPLHFTPFAPSS